MPTEAIDQFIDTLLREAKLDALPDDYKAQYRERLYDQIVNRIGIIAMQNLDETGAAEFGDLMKSGVKPNSEEAQNFFVQKIPDFEEKIRQGMEEFARQFITAATTA